MPALDYNAILTPGGAAQGFSELASTIAKIPQIRREQALKKMEIDMQAKALSGRMGMYDAMARYRGAMGDAAAQKADDNHALVGARVDHMGTQDANSTIRTTAQVGHWSVEDDNAAARLVEQGHANDITAARAMIEARKSVPTTERSAMEETPFNGPRSTQVNRDPTAVAADVSAAQALVPQRGPQRYGAAMGGGQPSAPPMQQPPQMVQPPMQQAPPVQDPLTDALAHAHPQDQAAYARIVATGDQARIRAAQQRLLSASAGAPPNAAP